MVTTEVGLCVSLEIGLLRFYGYRVSAEQYVNISYIPADDFYLAEDMRILLKCLLKYNFTGSIWLKIMHKPWTLISIRRSQGQCLKL
jgi:hypothetical protein